MKSRSETKRFNGKIISKGIMIGILIIVLGIILVDYSFNKVIPNFIFINEFSKLDANAYWTGGISIFTIMLSIVTIFQTTDKILFEKRFQLEIQKRETIRRYQDLLRTAIEILNNRYNNEYDKEKEMYTLQKK